MDKITALREVKSLVDDNTLRFSFYSDLKSVVLHEKNDVYIDKNKCKKLIDNLVDERMITRESYITLKDAINEDIALNKSKNSIKTYDEIEKDNKPLKGYFAGIIITILLNILGLILCISLGDKKCRKSSTITLIILFIIGFVVTSIIVVLSNYQIVQLPSK